MPVKSLAIKKALSRKRMATTGAPEHHKVLPLSLTVTKQEEFLYLNQVTKRKKVTPARQQSEVKVGHRRLKEVMQIL